MANMISRSGAMLDLDATAARFARREAGDAEAAIAALAAAAIRHWRLDEATFWQRVKFRARMLRAARDGAASRQAVGEATRC